MELQTPVWTRSSWSDGQVCSLLYSYVWRGPVERLDSNDHRAFRSFVRSFKDLVVAVVFPESGAKGPCLVRP